MGYEVAVAHVAARNVAAVTTSATPETLADTIYRSLDQVWPVLRAQEVEAGQNVVIYRDMLNAIDIGVEFLGPFEPSGDVVAVTTPAGEVVTTVHWGDYSAMPDAYRALEAWCAQNDRSHAEGWEVYGDWDDDPAKRRTDIFFRLAPA
ncbi:MAG TPA: GyrI-like domain-containing protein [Acidimicrobiales bacterium]|nr:GyrI-like domain-containing protein [Acidimicrobiales bacterium]